MVVRAVGQDDTVSFQLPFIPSGDVRQEHHCRTAGISLDPMSNALVLVFAHAFICQLSCLLLLALLELAVTGLRGVSWPGKQASLKQSIVLMLVA